MASYYPPVGFFFKVEFALDGAGNNDILFQAVSGLNYQLQTDTVKEGGENRFEHVVPTRAKCSSLQLRRGIFSFNDSAITQWCADAFQHFIFQPIDIMVKLLDETGNPLMTWNIHHAWPKSWKVADMNAEKGEVLIETFEINYNYFTFGS